MDGVCQNNSLNDWFEKSLQELEKEGFTTTHIDRFLGETCEKKSLIEPLSLFQEVIELLKERELDITIMPILVVSLRDSLFLASDVSDLKVEEEMSSEPPSVYLLSRKQLMLKNAVEEYKCPIKLKEGDDSEVNHLIYYRCFRDQLGIDNNWEYSRAVYFEYYPDSLL